MDDYPATAAARDRFVMARRASHPPHDPRRYQQLTVEDERTAGGTPARTATVFLTGRECPWRCVMCDLWRYTIPGNTPDGAIPAQVSAARRELEARGETIRQIKLYNASNFFDPGAVPTRDYPAIAAQLRGLDRVVVESHPALIGIRVDHFLEMLDDHAHGRAAAQLEVAMGLETAHPHALAQLHKRMTVETFAAAAAALGKRGVDLRVFLLIAPPFVPATEQQAWLLRSIAAAFACQASIVSLIPTRTGNGAIEALAAAGHFTPPRLADIETGLAMAIEHHAGGKRRIVADLWDLDRFSSCRDCFAARRARLHTMNLEQRIPPVIACPSCGTGQAS